MFKKKSNTTPRGEMTFFEHIDELRPRLMRIGIFLIVTAVAAFFFKHFIIDSVLLGPQSPEFITNRLMCRLSQIVGIPDLCINSTPLNIVNTRIAGQFNLHMSASIITALVLTVPYIVWELWQFVKPALTRNEVRSSNMFVLYVSLCFFVGLLFGYFIISPLTINFLGGYSASESIRNMTDVGSYISTVINVSLACAVVFQLPILVYFLARMGILSSHFMKKYRRHAVVAMAIFSAIITPPDVFSQILVALPLWGLYEMSISIARKIEHRKAQDDMTSYEQIYSEKTHN